MVYEKTAEVMAQIADEAVKTTSWEQLKNNLVRWTGALIMEQNAAGKWVISIGRVSWWTAFLPAIQIWVEGGDINPNHLTILLSLAGYLFGTKIVNGVKKHISKK